MTQYDPIGQRVIGASGLKYPLSLVTLLVNANLASSHDEARQLIQNCAVIVDGIKVEGRYSLEGDTTWWCCSEELRGSSISVNGANSVKAI